LQDLYPALWPKTSATTSSLSPALTLCALHMYTLVGFLSGPVPLKPWQGPPAAQQGLPSSAEAHSHQSIAAPPSGHPRICHHAHGQPCSGQNLASLSHGSPKNIPPLTHHSSPGGNSPVGRSPHISTQKSIDAGQSVSADKNVCACVCLSIACDCR
jgi:hypothetical protein